MDDVFENGIRIAGELIDVHLRFGNYSAGKEMYADLRYLLEDISHDDMVALVNKFGVAESCSGWVCKAWCDNMGIKNSIIEFETAFCIAPPGETFSYRKTKKTWGDLVTVGTDDPEIEKSQRLQYILKDSNPVRIKQTTRNELKIVLGSKLVNSAMRSNKEIFVEEVGPLEAAKIERLTALPIGKVWAAIRNGNKDLVDHLRRIPSPKREQMRRRGMYVADRYEPQLNLFAV